MAQFTIYQDTDPSAPTLTGQVGSLTTLLDAVLVNGYGSKTAAGWTIQNTGTNQRTYKLGGGTGLFMSIDDASPGTGGAQEARIRGFETSTGAITGTGPFPSASQGTGNAGYLTIRKSAAASATTRHWIAIADSVTLYFFAQTGDSAGVYFAWYFGDFYSLAGSGDTWRCGVLARAIDNSATGNADAMDVQCVPSAGNQSTGASANAFFIDRTYGGGGTSIVAGKHGDPGKENVASWSNAAGGAIGVAGIQTPNGPDNSYYLSPVWVTEATGSIVRGRLRGFWHVCHAAAGFSDGQTFTGVNDVAGKTFQIIKSSGSGGFYCIETSNTLDTN